VYVVGVYGSVCYVVCVVCCVCESWIDACGFVRVGKFRTINQCARCQRRNTIIKYRSLHTAQCTGRRQESHIPNVVLQRLRAGSPAYSSYCMLKMPTVWFTYCIPFTIVLYTVLIQVRYLNTGTVGGAVELRESNFLNYSLFVSRASLQE
jgi:hypothetical protein